MKTNTNRILSKTLVTGSNGSVASYADFGIKANRELFDITSMVQVMEAVEKLKPKVILHLAAETDLAKCEADPAHAYLVNSVGTYNLATAARMVGAKMVYVSTDAVFPHSETTHAVSDEPRPESIYGRSKYLGELAVRGMSDNYIIARTSWVFGGGLKRDKKFVAKFIGQLDKSEANAINDQSSSPTYARDLVSALKDLIVEGHTGTFHVVNSGTASRYDMALVIAKALGNKETKILPVSATVYGLQPYQKSSGGLKENLDLRSWQDALYDYIKTEWVGS